MKLKYSHLFLSISSVFVSSCMSQTKGKELQDNVFDLKTRILALESSLSEKDRKIVTANEETVKKIASTGSELDTIRNDLNKVKGEVDTLKIGVQKGELPGAEPGEDSVAQRIRNLEQKLSKVESAQEELLAAIEKSTSAKDKHKKDSKKAGDKDEKGGEKKALKNIGDVKQAYEKGRFKQVAESAAGLTKSASGEAKEELIFLHAESLYKLGKMREAALKYSEFTETYKKSKHLPQSYLRLGDTFRNLGDRSTAKIYYTDTISKFPSTAEASKAKERLSEVGN